MNKQRDPLFPICSAFDPVLSKCRVKTSRLRDPLAACMYHAPGRKCRLALAVPSANANQAFPPEVNGDVTVHSRRRENACMLACSIPFQGVFSGCPGREIDALLGVQKQTNKQTKIKEGKCCVGGSPRAKGGGVRWGALHRPKWRASPRTSHTIRAWEREGQSASQPWGAR